MRVTGARPRGSAGLRAMLPARRGLAASRVSSAARALAARPAAVLPVLLVLAAAVLPGCGESAPDGPARYVVVQRDFDWSVRDPGEPLPLGATWSFADGLGPWTVLDGQHRTDGDALVLSGRGELQLAGPWSDFVVDTELQHRLRLELATQGVGQLVVYWRRAGDTFDRERSFALPLEDTTEPHALSFRLSTLKASLSAPDAGEGFAELLLRFRPREENGEVLVRLVALGLLSDFTLPQGGRAPVQALERKGLRLAGPCRPLPGALLSTFEPGPGERLRLALAVAGRGREATVVVRDEEGRLPPVERTLTSNSPWRFVEVDLAPAAGERTTLVVEAVTRDGAASRVDGDSATVGEAVSGAGDGPGGVLLLGGVLRLAPDRRPVELPPPAPALPAPTDRPNVVLYLVDTLRADRLGAYGYGAPTDPMIGAVAAEGVRFADVTAASNWTRPSTSTLLTGVGPEVHGNLRPGDVVDPTLPTLAEAFAAEGYLTVSFVTNHHAGAWSGLDRGFDVAYEPRFFPRLQPDTTLTSQLVLEPLDRFLAEHADERLFVYVHTLDPHGPYEAPAEDVEVVAQAAPKWRPELPVGTAEQRAKAQDRMLAYDAEIRHNDRRVGSLLDALLALDLEDRTLLAFTSDHGEAFFEHGTWTHWRTLYQEEVGIPWVMRWPEGLPGGLVIEAPVGQADLAPTLLALAGGTPPDTWDGMDLSALCRRGAVVAGDGAASARARSPDDVARAEAIAALRSRVVVSDAVMEGRVHDDGASRLLAARRGPAKLVARVGADGRPEPVALFDLASDPAEKTDLLPTRGVDAGLLDALHAFLAEDARRAETRGVAPEDGTVDAERLQWLREMGYLK